MAARTTPELVKTIIEVDDTIDLGAFISAATTLVDRCCVYEADGETLLDYTSGDLEQIERWLAAHFYRIRDPDLTASTIGQLEDQYEGKVDLRLEVTKYGQMAMLLDTHGGLAALNNGLGKVEKVFPQATGRKPRVLWLGRKDTSR